MEIGERSPDQYEKRLARSAEALASARETVETELERRDQLIEEAADQGVPILRIARAAEITPARVRHVLGSPN